MRIVLCYPVEPKHLRQIAAAAPEAEIVDAGQDRVAEELFGADIFCGHAKVPVDWDGVVRQGRLQWIQSSAAGMDHCLVPVGHRSRRSPSPAPRAFWPTRWPSTPLRW